MLTLLLTLRPISQTRCSGELYYAPPTLRTDWRTFARSMGEWNSATRVSSTVAEGGSARPCRPCRHLLSHSARPLYVSWDLLAARPARMAHILSMLSGREALWQQRRDRAHARQFLRVTHNFFAVNASTTLPGSPVNIFGANRAPGGAGKWKMSFFGIAISPAWERG